MILFNERGTYINFFQIHFAPELSVNNLGAIRVSELSGDEWVACFTGRSTIDIISDLLDSSEKRQIIGMLQKLNGRFTGPSDDDLRPDNIAKEWSKIIL